MTEHRKENDKATDTTTFKTYGYRYVPFINDNLKLGGLESRKEYSCSSYDRKNRPLRG